MKNKTKLKFKPTPISRLFKYNMPIKMVGDPDWVGGGPDWYVGGQYKQAWANREKAVYAHMMDMKAWPMPWSPETWHRAWEDNELLDFHLLNKWLDYSYALEENLLFDREQAERDNAAWDYHHENFIAA
jgi:hypothetical protein